MPDSKYCYPNSDILKNKLNITDARDLFEAEKKITYIKLKKLENNPIKGNYDFAHLKAIHKYIFQDIYEWAGKERTVEIGKGNLFCTTQFIQEYAQSVFNKYFSQCYAAKDNFDEFIRVFANNYGDLNALHPFREGNGRAQREFARLVCLKCGYKFDLYCTTHKEMLSASILSFDKGDNSGFVKIFSKAVMPIDNNTSMDNNRLGILSEDDLTIVNGNYEYKGYDEYQENEKYNEIYKSKIQKMDNEYEEIEDDEEDFEEYIMPRKIKR